MQAIRVYNPQLDREFEDAYYDREDAAIATLEALGARLTDSYHSNEVKLDGRTIYGQNWQHALAQATA